jgi:putative acetyltransferase
MGSIVVRHTEPQDWPSVKDIYTHPVAHSGTLQLPYPSGKVWEQRLSNIPDNVYSFVAEFDGKIVGNLGMEIQKNPRRRHVASFGMGVMDDYQGQGVGSALIGAMIELADNWLNVRRIELTVFSDNLSAIALYEKFGFVQEGIAQGFAYRNGEYVDAIYMARLRT